MSEGPLFTAYHPHKTTTLYRRNLPHLRQEGATYFVTKRLADSIPRQVLLAWEEERRVWEEANGIFDTMTSEERRSAWRAVSACRRQAFRRQQRHRVERALDACYGSCLLRNASNAEVLAKSLRFFDGSRVWCGDFVIMPNHLHWLVLPMVGHTLEQCVQSVTRHAAAKINQAEGRSGRFWQKESYDRLVRSRLELERIRTYIAENPVKAGLGVGEYVYHRASWLDM